MRVVRWGLVLAVAGGCAATRSATPPAQEPRPSVTAYCEARVAGMRERAARVISAEPDPTNQVDFARVILPRARRVWRPIDRPYLPVYVGPLTYIGSEPRSRKDVFTREQDGAELAAQLEARLEKMRAQSEESGPEPMILVIATAVGSVTAADAIRVAAAAPAETIVGLLVRRPEQAILDDWRRLATASPSFALNGALDGLGSDPFRDLRPRVDPPLRGWIWGWDDPERDILARYFDPPPNGNRLARHLNSLEGLCAEAAAVRDLYRGGAGADRVLPALADATEACGCRGLAPEALEGLYIFLLRPPPLYGWIPLPRRPHSALLNVEDLVDFAEAGGAP